jgi:hypothetical protein
MLKYIFTEVTKQFVNYIPWQRYLILQGAWLRSSERKQPW